MRVSLKKVIRTLKLSLNIMLLGLVAVQSASVIKLTSCLHVSSFNFFFNFRFSWL
jgi:hypothetical protein